MLRTNVARKVSSEFLTNTNVCLSSKQFSAYQRIRRVPEPGDSKHQYRYVNICSNCLRISTQGYSTGRKLNPESHTALLFIIHWPVSRRLFKRLCCYSTAWWLPRQWSPRLWGGWWSRCTSTSWSSSAGSLPSEGQCSHFGHGQLRSTPRAATVDLLRKGTCETEPFFLPALAQQFCQEIRFLPPLLFQCTSRS